MATRSAPPTLITRGSRVATLFAVVALAATFVVLSPGARASAATASCLPHQVSVTNTVSSRPGGTTAQLVFTAYVGPNCL